ncbi:CBS domain-containing protein [Actinomadura sp. WMMA1423]|uniref:CBS domain-containing protein n=1 Tax=Actinomadura sp. WMMA1423 TaxID=2591108 RepID=UPI001146608C|nr:CBS domain-containing protein [Actinomadura sp. WMMA1423]
MTLPPELQNAAADPVELTVGRLLALFGERNRDPGIVAGIDTALSEAGLRCVPSLIHGNLSSTVTVGPLEEAREAPEPGGEEETLAATALRIGDLPTARMPDGALVHLLPEDDLPRARMLMLENRFSQLPVLSGVMLKGVVSWQSIAMAHARGQCESLTDVTEPAREVSIDAELLVTIPDIIENNCVFVHDDHKITGLVTVADLSLEFGRLTGPFLRLGEIERRLRKCVNRMCGTAEELRAASGNNKADCPEDLTIWQIQQVFAKPDCWARLPWALHRDDFVTRLDAVRKIRNEVAHFRPNPLTETQLKQVDAFAGLLKTFVP